MKLGFIGSGNMATAIMNGVMKNGIFEPGEIIASDVSKTGRNRTKESLGVVVTADNTEVVKQAEVVVLSIKPQYYAEVIKEIRDFVSEKQIIITIAPGKTLVWLEEQFGKNVKIVRTMPNTPAMVLEGVTAVCRNDEVIDEELDYVCKILSSFGQVEQISEKLMDIFTATCGSSPAYVFMFIEAMADAAVAGGIPRAQAYKMASQAVVGSAKMILELEKHPGELKDMVCSPAGSTIEAVRVLEEKGFRSAVIEAMRACAKKSSKM